MMINITQRYQAIEETYSRIRTHIGLFWPGNQIAEYRDLDGPMRSLPNWKVLEIEPINDTEPWTYITWGAWEITKDEIYEKGRYGLEFIIQSPRKDLIHVKSLAMVTVYHANPKYRVKLGDALEIGRPWINQSLADHFLVSLPYPISTDFETLKFNDLYISFWWLVPITGKEAMYRQTHGNDALWQIFDECDLKYLDVNRKSAV